jgi:internalin A
VSLTNNEITDAGLASLRGLSRLRELELRQTPVSDDGLTHLHGLRTLGELDLRDTGVSLAGVLALQRSLPKRKLRVQSR